MRSDHLPVELVERLPAALDAVPAGDRRERLAGPDHMRPALEFVPLGTDGPRLPSLDAQHLLRDPDLLAARGEVRARCVGQSAERLPGGLPELQSSVEAVPGVRVPAATALALGETAPRPLVLGAVVRHPARHRRTGCRGRWSRGRWRRDRHLGGEYGQGDGDDSRVPHALDRHRATLGRPVTALRRAAQASDGAPPGRRTGWDPSPRARVRITTPGSEPRAQGLGPKALDCLGLTASG